VTGLVEAGRMPRLCGLQVQVLVHARRDLVALDDLLADDLLAVEVGVLLPIVVLRRSSLCTWHRSVRPR